MKLGFPSQAGKLAKYLKDYVLICGGVNLGYPTTQSTKYSKGRRKVAGFFGTGTDSHTICIMGSYNDEVYGPCFVTKTTNEVWGGSFSFKKSNGRKVKVPAKYVSFAIYPVQYVDRINANRRGLPSGVDEVIGIQPVGPVPTEPVALVPAKPAAPMKHRDDIDTEQPRYKKSYRDKEYAGLEYIGTEVKDNRDITKDEKKSMREDLIKQFPNVVIDAMKYNGLDQGPDGACMIASLLNLINLVGKNYHHGNKKWSKIKSARYWSKIYKAAVVKPQSGDFDELLVNGASQKLIKNIQSDPDFRYVPIVGRTRSELYMNKDLVKDGSDRNNLIRFIREFFESLIDKGIPVAISWNGHARVLVGYNDTQVLFADSWGDNYKQITHMPMLKLDDYFRAGFSTMNKKNVYANVRDCIYFVKSAPRVEPVELSLIHISEPTRLLSIADCGVGV